MVEHTKGPWKARVFGDDPYDIGKTVEQRGRPYQPVAEVEIARICLCKSLILNGAKSHPLSCGRHRVRWTV